MGKITLEVSDKLSEKLLKMDDRLPEFLALSLQQPPLSAKIYRYILDFLASKPTPEEIIAFRPTDEMEKRLKSLLMLSKTGNIAPVEIEELDEYEQIEHLIVMLKAGSLPYLQG